MYKKSVIIFLLLALVISLYFIFRTKDPQVITNYPPKNEKIIAFGDSLIAGNGSTERNDFVSLLSKKIGKSIINMGVPGDTTAKGLDRVSEVVAKDPGVVLVLFGGNDFLRRLPKAETFANLRSIISELQANGTMIVLLGIRGGVTTDQFKKDFKDLAKEKGVIYVPDVLEGLLVHSEYMSDAIHPNDRGYAIIADKVYEAIKNYLQ